MADKNNLETSPYLFGYPEFGLAYEQYRRTQKMLEEKYAEMNKTVDTEVERVEHIISKVEDPEYRHGKHKKYHKELLRELNKTLDSTKKQVKDKQANNTDNKKDNKEKPEITEKTESIKKDKPVKNKSKENRNNFNKNNLNKPNFNKNNKNNFKNNSQNKNNFKKSNNFKKNNKKEQNGIEKS